MKPLLPLVLPLGLLASCGTRDGEENLVWTIENESAEPLPRTMPVDPIGIRPIPPIPAALHGCWDSIPPDDPEEPYGQMRVIIDAKSITEHSDGVGKRVATADFIEQVTDRSIRGRFSAAGENGPITVATAIILGPDEMLSLPPGLLRIQEGDAGGALFEPCR